MVRAKAVVCLVSSVLLGAQLAWSTTISSSFLGPGEWTSDWDGAIEYARNNNVDYYLINFGKTEGCSLCNQAANFIYNTQEFKNWATTNHIALVYVDYNDGGEYSPLVKRLDSLYPGIVGFPTLIIVDGRDGTTKIGLFKPVYKKTYNGVTLDPLNTENFVKVVHSFVDPYFAGGSSGDSYDPFDDDLTNATCLAMSPTYQEHGVHTLKGNDMADWFAMTNLVAGGRYRLSVTNLVDQSAVANFAMYTNQQSASEGVAAKSGLLQVLSSGLYFDSYVTGKGYLQLSRSVTNADVTYTFGYRQVDMSQHYQLVVNDDSGVVRTNSLAEGTVADIAAPQTKGLFFIGWEATPVNADLGVAFDATQAASTIVMPSYNVSLRAVYGVETRIMELSGNLAFGNVRTNTTKEAVLVVSNRGNRSLNVKGITCPDGFSVETASFTVAASGSSNVTVRFAPLEVREYGGVAATITVESDDMTAGTNTIICTGMGVDNQAPVITDQSLVANPRINEKGSAAFKVVASDDSDPMPETKGMASVSWLVDGVLKKTYTNGAPGSISSSFSFTTDSNTVSQVPFREVPVKAVARDILGATSEINWTVVVTNVAAAQTLDFPALAPKALGDADFDPGATASSELPVEYASGNEAVASVTAEGRLHIVAAGTALITARQPGNYDFKAATPKTQTLTVKARLTAVVPEGGGTVSGTGLYNPGATVTLKASALTGYTLLQWEDGSQETSRNLVMPNANVVVEAHFAVTTNIPSPSITALDALRLTVGVATTQALAVVTSASRLTKTEVKGLPLYGGLSYSVASNVITITGVPTVSVTNKTVTVTASNVSGTSTNTFYLTVDPLPAWAQGNFNGSFSHGGLGSGLAVMDVTKLGKVTGKLSTGGSNYLFSAASYARRDGDGAFWVSVDAKNGTKATLPLLLKVAPAVIEEGGEWLPETIAAAEGRFGSREDGLPDAALYRNIWKDTGMVTVLTNQFVAYYTATLPVTFDEPVIVSQAALGVKTDTGASAASVGSGYLAFTVEKTGVVKTAGKLADGTAVTLSGTLVADGAGRTWTLLYYAPTAYKGGQFFGLVEFVKPAEGGPVFVRPLLDSALQWTSLNPMATSEYGTGFVRETDVVGGWYDKVGNLYAYYMGKALSVGTYALADAPQIKVGTERYESVWWDPAGLSLTVDTNSLGVMTGLKAPKAGTPKKVDGEYVYDVATNTVGMTFTLARATGLYNGTFKAWFDYGTETVTHTSRSLSFQGILTPVREDPADGVEGRGFFLWADKAEYLNAQNVPSTYEFKWSYDFVIESALLP